MKDIKIIIAGGVGLAICLSYAFLFEPIANVGDSGTYLTYAQLVVDNGNTSGLIHRSPLYPLVLAAFLSFLSPGITVKVMIFVQYILVWLTFLMLMDITRQLFKKSWQVILIGFLFLINFSVIYYGYTILTETLSLFLLMLSMWLFIMQPVKNNILNSAVVALVFSLLVLARFNTLPLLMVFLVLFIIRDYNRGVNYLKKLLPGVTAFFVVALIILNVYATHNYNRHGFYGLFPMGGSSIVSRNALIATIKGDEEVSKENKEALKIVSAAKQKYLNERSAQEKKGSLLTMDMWGIADILYIGFPVYSLAQGELLAHFGIDPESPEPELSDALKPFYKEIRQINSSVIWELRFVSLVSSFRSSTGLVNSIGDNKNLALLPGVIIKAYKIIIFLVSAFVFCAMIIWFVKIILGKALLNRSIAIISIIYMSFLFINFSLAIAGDSNRYKYPVEPFIIILVLWFLTELFYSRKVSYRE